MNAKCYKLSITAHILVESDDKIEEVITQPIIIYRGTEFNYETIESIERITLQEFEKRRST